jgi:hypothetical protein
MTRITGRSGVNGLYIETTCLKAQYYLSQAILTEDLHSLQSELGGDLAYKIT